MSATVFDSRSVRLTLRLWLAFVLACSSAACWASGSVAQAEIEAISLPVFNAFLRVEKIGTANQVVELADAELRHQLTRFFGNKEEVVDDMLRLAAELLA